MKTVYVALEFADKKARKVLDLANFTPFPAAKSTVLKEFKSLTTKGKATKAVWSDRKFKSVSTHTARVSDGEYNAIRDFMKSNLRVNLLRADGVSIAD